jgi:hypothetical protein
MTIDRYTKFILTIIAIGIWTLAAAIFFQPSPIQATEEMQDINIERIGGSFISGAIPVEVQGTVTIEFDEEPVFAIED